MRRDRGVAIVADTNARHLRGKVGELFTGKAAADREKPVDEVGAQRREGLSAVRVRATIPWSPQHTLRDLQTTDLLMERRPKSIARLDALRIERVGLGKALRR